VLSVLRCCAVHHPALQAILSLFPSLWEVPLEAMSIVVKVRKAALAVVCKHMRGKGSVCTAGSQTLNKVA
jgi:hypothetical protein